MLPPRGALRISSLGTSSGPTWRPPLRALQRFGVCCTGYWISEATSRTSCRRGGERIGRCPAGRGVEERDSLPRVPDGTGRKAINKEIKKTAGQLATGLKLRRASCTGSLEVPPEGASGGCAGPPLSAHHVIREPPYPRQSRWCRLAHSGLLSL